MENIEIQTPVVETKKVKRVPLSEEEKELRKKERQKKVSDYKVQRYAEDEEYRQKKKELGKLYYRKRKEREYLEKHGSLEGFEIKSRKATNIKDETSA